MCQHRIVTYTNVKGETETTQFFSFEDFKNVIIDNLGDDAWEALLFFKDKDIPEHENTAIDFIEAGYFCEQILESGVIKAFINNILKDLKAQGYIKKNKSLIEFQYCEDEYKEIIDEKLSPGIMDFFE